MANGGFSVKKTKWFWLYYVLGALMIVASFLLAPFWSEVDIFFSDWGANAVSFMVAFAIALYLIFYLAKKIKSSPNQTILILTIIEFILLMVIALGSVLSQFDILKIQGPGQIIALALWLRGVVEIVRAYFYRREISETYPIWQLVIAIAMVTLGTYLFAKPFISTEVLQWILCSIILVLGIVFIFIGAKAKPRR
ncbi:MAG: hypothetical protein IJZ93_04205 [Clostridia bacterium]|nr:hypothetical protein [Clostridia bacterium]